MMSGFDYLVITPRGEQLRGRLDAAALAEAERRLRGDGHVIVELQAIGQRASLWRLLNQDVSFGPAIARRALPSLTRQLAELLLAGIALDDALGVLTAGSRGRTRETIAALRESVRGGLSLEAALRADRSFSGRYRAVVAAGEASGELGPVLLKLGQDLETEADFEETFRSSLVYPCFLCVAALTAMIVLLVVVVPSLEALVADSADRLPMVTQVVIAASHAVRDRGGDLALGLVFFVITCRLLVLLPSVRRPITLWLLRLPVIGQSVREANLGRFCRALATLLSGGVSLSASLGMASQAVTNSVLTGRLLQAGQEVMVGRGLADALEASGCLPADGLAMLRVGERTGRLASAFNQIALVLEQRVNRRLKKAAAAIGPALTLAMGLLAGIIVYSMMTTVMTLNDMAVQ